MQSRDDSATNPSLILRLASDPTDQAAWRSFVAAYAPRIVRWCRDWGIPDKEMEDVTQQVLLKLLKRMGGFRYDPSRTFRGWLRTLVNHACSDFEAGSQSALSASGDSRVLAILQNLEARADLCRQIEEQFDLELLEEAERRVRLRVAPSTWEAYRLTAVEGLSGTEVAARLKMKVANVFVAKSKVLKRIRDEVQSLESPSS